MLQAANTHHLQQRQVTQKLTTIESCLFFIFLEVQRKTFILVVATVSFCFCFTDQSSWFSKTFSRPIFWFWLQKTKQTAAFL